MKTAVKDKTLIPSRMGFSFNNLYRYSDVGGGFELLESIRKYPINFLMDPIFLSKLPENDVLGVFTTTHHSNGHRTLK